MKHCKSRSTKDDEDYDFLFKVILSGDSGVGKSNLLLRKTNPTIGVEFAVKDIVLPNGIRLKAQIWDTSGCERYRSITTGHFRKAVGALLVYDLTNEDSFTNLSYWLSALKENAESHLVVALVANKCDIMFTDPTRREVQKEHAVKFAKNNDIIFFEESSALADINVKEIIEHLFLKIYEVQMKLIQEGKKKKETLKLSYEEENERANASCC